MKAKSSNIEQKEVEEQFIGEAELESWWHKTNLFGIFVKEVVEHFVERAKWKKGRSEASSVEIGWLKILMAMLFQSEQEKGMPLKIGAYAGKNLVENIVKQGKNSNHSSAIEEKYFIKLPDEDYLIDILTKYLNEKYFVIQNGSLSLAHHFNRNKKLGKLIGQRIDRGKLFLITGGPGTGKTTKIFGLLKEKWEQSPQLIKLLTPTGKAAVRLKESLLTEIKKKTDFNEKKDFHLVGDLQNKSLGYTRDAALVRLAAFIERTEIETLHRFMGSAKNKILSSRVKDKIFLYDHIFIDEASMISAQRLEKLLAVASEGCTITLIGDPDQLPPVESNYNLLHEILVHFFSGHGKGAETLTKDNGTSKKGWTNLDAQSGTPPKKDSEQKANHNESQQAKGGGSVQVSYRFDKDILELCGLLKGIIWSLRERKADEARGKVKRKEKGQASEKAEEAWKNFREVMYTKTKSANKPDQNFFFLSESKEHSQSKEHFESDSLEMCTSFLGQHYKEYIKKIRDVNRRLYYGDGTIGEESVRAGERKKTREKHLSPAEKKLATAQKFSSLAKELLDFYQKKNRIDSNQSRKTRLIRTWALLIE